MSSGSDNTQSSQNLPGTFSPNPSFPWVGIPDSDLWTKHYPTTWNPFVFRRNPRPSIQCTGDLETTSFSDNTTGNRCFRSEGRIFSHTMLCLRLYLFTSFPVNGFLLCSLLLECSLNKLFASFGFLLLKLPKALSTKKLSPNPPFRQKSNSSAEISQILTAFLHT